VQELKQELCQMQIQERQKEIERETLQREVRQLRGTCEILQQNKDEVLQENY